MKRRALQTILLLLPVLIGLLCTGCRRPELSITVEPPVGFRLTDLSLDIRIYVPGDIEVTHCDRLLYDELTLDELTAALVHTQPLEEDGVVEAFPVFGEKMVVVDARDADGVLAMRGCAQHGELAYGPQRLTVPLFAAATIVTDEQLLLEAEVDTPLPPLLVSTTDYQGEPAAGVLVRARLLSSGGR